MTTHNMSNHPVYHVWQKMHQRCKNPNNPRYHRYGGRGIEVCERWQTFEGFWGDNQDQYAPGLTIDRIDGNGNYEPSNIQWITQPENSSKTCRASPVTCVMLIDDEIVVEHFPNLRQASQITDTPLTTLNRTIRNKRPNDAGQYWVYSEDVPTINFQAEFAAPRKRSTDSGRSRAVTCEVAGNVREYRSVTEGAKYEASSKATINQALKSGRRTRKGELWQYASEPATV